MFARCLPCAVSLLILATLPVGLISAQEPENVLPNASFQTAKDGSPEGWTTHTWHGQAKFAHDDAGRDGSRCVTIESTVGADASWYVEVPVRPQTMYRLSGWVKTDNVRPDGGRGALLNLHNIQGVATDAVTGTADWTRVEVLFSSGDNDHVWVNCLFGGWGHATGKARFDDIALTPLSLKDWSPAVTIHTERRGEPISKYVYGQFIEHLGRCIYGGIWAEMLEDRKFHDGVGRPGSPWEGFGQSPVEMVKENSFVGEQTPKIAAGNGLRQKGLGLVEGKQYVGYVWLRAVAGDPVTARVSLAWDLGKTDAELQTVTIENVAARYTKYPVRFTAGKSADDANLSIKVDGGSALIGTASLMPADNVEGFRADTLELLRELDSPVYRWPGGNFVSGYDWEDGIGDRDSRPPRKNPAWKGIEHNDVGIDEFMALCRLLDAEPYVAVNSGLGGVESAVAELKYVNGPAGSPMGKLRAENGHPEPYAVKWWGIGNEMYGGWQLGHMSLEKYIAKHNEFAVAMREADASIKLVAVGATGNWSEGMMQHCADKMDLVSEHFYCQNRPGVIAHVEQIPAAIRHKAETHRQYRKRFDSLAGKDIRIALDEWNYWYGPHVFGELGTRYFLKDALGIAAGLHEYARQSDIMFMANYAQTVNVIGCIKTDKTNAAFATTGLVLKLYRKQFGRIPLEVTTARPLDVAAALSEDGRTLTVGIVNPTAQRLDLSIDVPGVELTGDGNRWEIAGDDPMAFNEPGKPPKIEIVQSPVSGIGGTLAVAPLSVTLYALPLK